MGGGGGRAFSVLFFLRSGERGGRMGQTEGYPGAFLAGPVAGEGHVYVPKCVCAASPTIPVGADPRLPASHLPELFPECGIWVRKGEGERGCLWRQHWHLGSWPVPSGWVRWVGSSMPCPWPLGRGLHGQALTVSVIAPHISHSLANGLRAYMPM